MVGCRVWTQVAALAVIGTILFGVAPARFRKIEQHARLRHALFIGQRHKRGRGFGWSVLAYKSADLCGLLSLDGTVIAPRAAKPWRGKPNAGGERRR